MKPSWGDAPEWAQWLAMDVDGEWNWFEAEPQIVRSLWCVAAGKQHTKAEPNFGNWKNTLEQRP